MYIKDDPQYSFDKGWFLTPQLDMEHKLIKISEAINWDRLTEGLVKLYSENGRPAKPCRAKVGLLILKHLFSLSDRDTVDMLKMNFYWQYFCNISVHEAKKFIHASTLTVFRGDIGREGVRLIEEEIMRVLKEGGYLKGI